MGTESQVYRAQDPVERSDAIKAFQDDDGSFIQAMAVVDDNGDQRGTSGSPLYISITSEAGAQTFQDVKLAGDNDSQVGLSGAPLEVNIRSINGPLETAFSRLRVANPFTLADIENRYEFDTNIWASGAVNSAVVQHFPHKAAITLSASTVNSSSAHVISLRNYRYQAGKGGLIEQTLVLSNTAEANCIRRWGYYDRDGDGIYWTLSGTTLGIVERTSAPDGVQRETFTPQSSFNLDTLDGNGSSGFDIDPSKTNIYWHSFQWLGVGAWVTGVVDSDGNFIAAHVLRHANQKTEVYMRTAVLPLQYEIENIGVLSATAGMDVICATVISEGGSEPPEEPFSAATLDFLTTANNNEYPILSIRAKTNINGVRNKIETLLKHINIAAESKAAFVRLRKNPSLTGASWQDVDVRSAMEYDLSASANQWVTGDPQAGQLINTEVVGAGETKHINLDDLFGVNKEYITYDNSDNQNIYTLTMQRTGGANPNVLVGMTWAEVR